MAAPSTAVSSSSQNQSLSQSQSQSQARSWPDSLASTAMGRLSGDPEYELVFLVATILAPLEMNLNVARYDELLAAVKRQAAQLEFHQAATLQQLLTVAASPPSSPPALPKFETLNELLQHAIDLNLANLEIRAGRDNADRLAAPAAAYHTLVRRALFQLTSVPGALRFAVLNFKEGTVSALLELASTVHAALMLLHAPHRNRLTSGHDASDEIEVTEVTDHREMEGRLQYQVQVKGADRAQWIYPEDVSIPSKLIDAHLKKKPISSKLRRLGDSAAVRADPLRQIVEVPVALVLGTLGSFVTQCEAAHDEATLALFAQPLSEVLMSLPSPTLQVRLVTSLPPSSALFVTLLGALFVNPSAPPPPASTSVASLGAALNVHLNWRAGDAGSKQTRAKLRGSEMSTSSVGAGANELVLLALIHRVLVAAACNNASTKGAEGSDGFFEALDVTVREALKHRDFDSVEKAAVEHFLGLLRSLLPTSR